MLRVERRFQQLEILLKEHFRALCWVIETPPSSLLHPIQWGQGIDFWGSAHITIVTDKCSNGSLRCHIVPNRAPLGLSSGINKFSHRSQTIAGRTCPLMSRGIACSNLRLAAFKICWYTLRLASVSLSDGFILQLLNLPHPPARRSTTVAHCARMAWFVRDEPALDADYMIREGGRICPA